MGKLTILALRVVLAAALAGSLVVQTVMIPLLAIELTGPAVVDLRLPLVVITVLGIGTTQVVMVCLWRLLTMVQRGTVFSETAFRFVDRIIAAVAGAALLAFTLGVTLAPGDAVAPGVVLLIGGAAVVLAGIALVVVVMRQLLAQAVARDVEAHQLQAELDEVI